MARSAVHTARSVPESSLDLFAEAHLDDPYGDYRGLRNSGPAVYFPSYEVWALPRYEECRAALADWKTFTSEEGVSVAPEFKPLFDNSPLYSDPPRHERLRRVLSERLAPRALASLKEDIDERADRLIAALVERGSFDAVADMAAIFPINVVSDLVGLPQEGREHFLERAAATFNLFGPNNARAQAAMGHYEAVGKYILESATRETLTPGGFGMTIYDAVDAGTIDETEGFVLMVAYLVAALDTTVNTLSASIWHLARNREQWALLRDDPELAGNAFEEALRVETPLVFFARTARTDCTFGEVTIPAGARVLVMFASANRDERRWEEPDRFDVQRETTGHLGFGYGIHGCAGQGLARLEGRAILAALARRAKSIEVGEPVREYNNVIRGLKSLPTVVTPA
jgi:cytochrome P450